MDKDKSLIPIGSYCYKIDRLHDGPELGDGCISTVYCPYSSYKKIAGVSVPWCNFLDEGGDNNNWTDEDYDKLEKHYGGEEKMSEALPLDLLWDSCKECGENYEEDFDLDLDIKEDRNKLENLNLEWIKKIKKLNGTII